MAQPTPEEQRSQQSWYKQKVFWLLMSGPIIVVIAAFITLKIASDNIADLVSDDYYKDGKHINLQLERDVEAAKRGIVAQVLFNADGTAAKVFVSGDFKREAPLKLTLLHPARKDADHVAPLKAASSLQSGDKSEYLATFAALPKTVHWYVRVEDEAGTWRVEEKWLPSQGGAVELKAKNSVLVQTAVASAASGAH